ncbi:mechanosensitive ion channel family protein [Synechococcus sp. N32]|uniref:mechanosensitive ion channel family protein n=1 Tax=Synechococcus sp. N32 TaxID=2575514 RepID=UPI00352D1C51
MITQITSEATTWLGYLQRGSVLIQVGFFVAAISSESRVKRKLNSPLIASLTHLIVPAALFISASVLTLAGITAGFLQYLALLWVLWRCVEPTKQLIHQRFPKVPVEEIDKSFFRPVLLVMSILTFVQMLGSRESLSLISLGDVFGVTLTIGKLFTALVIVYMVIALASRPAAFAAWLGGSFFGIRPQGRKALEVILRYSVIGVGVMGVAYYIGINGTALVAVAGGLSVGIGFGIKEIISNFISSLWLLFEGSVRPGEILMINGDPCTVRKLGLRATQLRRGRDGAELLIPNQNFFTQEAESYTAEETSRRDAVVVGAAYHHEPSQVIAVLEEVARQHEKVLEYPPPQAFTVDFADSSINYKLLFWVRNPLEAFAVGSDLRQAIWTAFDKNGSAFPSRSDRCIQWNGPPPRNKPTGLAAPPSSSRQKQTAIQPTIQLARRRR